MGGGGGGEERVGGRGGGGRVDRWVGKKTLNHI